MRPFDGQDEAMLVELGCEGSKLARTAVEWFDGGCGLVAATGGFTGVYDRIELEHKQRGEMLMELSRRDHVTRSI